MTAGNNGRQGRKPPVGKPFQPGQSGNPSGRPKLTPQEEDAIALAKQFAPDAVRALHSICTDTKAEPKARAICANSILDRAWGKPKETIDATVRHEHRSESEILADLQALGLALAGGAAGEGTANGKGRSEVH